MCVPPEQCPALESCFTAVDRREGMHASILLLIDGGTLSLPQDLVLPSRYGRWKETRNRVPHLASRCKPMVGALAERQQRECSSARCLESARCATQRILAEPSGGSGGFSVTPQPEYSLAWPGVAL